METNNFKPMNRPTYITTNDSDRKLYRAIFAANKFLRENGPKTVYEVELSLNKNLKAPSEIKQKEMFLDLVKNRPQTRNDMCKILELLGDGTEESNLKKASRFSDERFADHYYALFMRCVGYKAALDNTGDLYKQYTKNLQDEGYNALIDSNDRRDSYMQSTIPIILINTINDTIGDVKVSELTKKESIEAFETLFEELSHNR